MNATSRKKKPAPSGSVLETQAVLHRITAKVNELAKELDRLQEARAIAEEVHRQQIRVSLRSAVPEEREMAERIADFWEVSP